MIGVVGALWSASGYVGAFGRAMNRVYEIDEGRPFWKLRPVMLLVTLVAILLVAVVLVMLIVSGPLASSIGSVIGLGSQAVTVWNIVKWPVIVLFVVLIVAILYYATPNVKQPKFRWLSVGAVVAIVIWILASVAFAFYVATFGSYNKTYGSLAGAVVGLLWLWITNLALLFGAELDSELERGRQLQAGIAAEEELQLPARDTRGIKKARKKEQKDMARGRAIREEADETTSPPTHRRERHHEEADPADCLRAGLRAGRPRRTRALRADHGHRRQGATGPAGAGEDPAGRRRRQAAGARRGRQGDQRRRRGRRCRQGQGRWLPATLAQPHHMAGPQGDLP